MATMHIPASVHLRFTQHQSFTLECLVVAGEQSTNLYILTTNSSRTASWRMTTTGSSLIFPVMKLAAVFLMLIFSLRVNQFGTHACLL